MSNPRPVPEALESIRLTLHEADKAFASVIHWQQHQDNELDTRGMRDEGEQLVDFFIEKAFVQTLILLESLGLPQSWKLFEQQYQEAKKKGFHDSTMGPEEP